MITAILRKYVSLGAALLVCGGLLGGLGCGGGGGGDGGTTPQTGRAVLGPLAGATAEIYEVRANASFALLLTETTSAGPALASTGLFDAHREALTDSGLYLIKVIGGEDVDADDDGVLDPAPTTNRGAIHAVGTGAMLKAGVYQVNVLTEIAYHGIVYLLMAGYPASAVVEGLDTYATYLLERDVDADGVLLVGSLLYVADDDGLQIVDVSDPDNPTLVATHTGAAGLVIYDITDPTNPTHLASEQVPMDCEGVAVHGNYVYLSQRDAGVQVFDVSDPADPDSLGTCKLFGEANGLCCGADYAFVAAEDHGGFRVVDVNPHSPALFTHTLDVPVVAVVDTYDADDVVTDGRYAYVVTEDNVAALDLQDPTQPVALDDISIGGSMDGEITRVALDETRDLLYVTMGENGTQIVDVSTPAALAKRDFYDDHLGPQHFTADVTSQGDYVYTAETHLPRFLAIDVSNPDSVSQAGDQNGPNHGLRGVSMLDATHVCTAWGFAGMQVVNVSNPSNPQIVGGTTLPAGLADPHDGAFVSNLGTHGNFAYVYGDERTWIVNVGTPASPTVAGQLEGPDTFDYAFSGNHVYMATAVRGIAIGNIADKANPTMVARVPLEGKCTGIAVLGDYLLVAAWDHLLVVRRPQIESVP